MVVRLVPGRTKHALRHVRLHSAGYAEMVHGDGSLSWTIFTTKPSDNYVTEVHPTLGRTMSLCLPMLVSGNRLATEMFKGPVLVAALFI